MTSILSGEVGGDSERNGDGRMHGLAAGIVTDNADPEGLARVRVRLSWMDDAQASSWARLAVPMAGADRGTYFLPEIGDEVLIGAENGDPAHLYVLGMLWNGQQKPPEANHDGRNDRRLVKTRGGHQLLFDDGERPVVELKLKDGKRLRLDDEGVLLEDGTNLLRIETSTSGITIKSAASLKLKSQSIAIEAGVSLEIKSAGALTIKGAMVQIN